MNSTVERFLNTTVAIVNETLADEAKVEQSLAEKVAAVPWWRWVIIIALVTLTACYSGLNLGVMALDVEDMEMMI